ncbi:MAG: Omp28 family outer membrane lipoprotein [Marinilabiliaceae bacterium]|nr:Omp28 family outer membrane lipoprotein [Marinilabiliaceae bacterium]
MKKITFFLGIIVSILGIVSCDIIPESNWTKQIIDDSTPTDSTIVTKNVLVAYFTDQTCVNCPASSVFLDSLKTLRGDTLVIVTIHSHPNPTAAMNLVTDKGREYNAHFEANFHPSASIDGDNILTSDFWEGAINRRTKEETEIEMQMICGFDERIEYIFVNTTITSTQNISDINLLLWITESDIVAAQATPTGINREYVHKHVFRDAINGTWGEEITLLEEEVLEITKTFDISEKEWKPENISIVAFIYDVNTFEVYQVLEMKLFKE